MSWMKCLLVIEPHGWYGMTFEEFFCNKRILITGHTGFKGAWLSLWLFNLGAKVAGYSLEPPTDPNLFSLLELDKKISHRIGDIRNEHDLSVSFEEFSPEIVFHMAAQSLVRLSYREPKLTYETNVIGTVNILEAARKTDGVRVVVNVTSDKCYDNKEWIYGYRETDPMGGYDPYSSSKGCSELVTSAYVRSYFPPEGFGKTHGVSVASARAGNVIGGGDWAADRLIPDFIRAVLKGEKVMIRNPGAIRPWQHVFEPLSGYLMLAKRLYENGPEFSGAWNFGPNDYDVISVEKLVRSLCSKWQGNPYYVINADQHPHEAHYLKLDCSKAKSYLEWRPRWNIEKALDSVIEWKQGYLDKKDVTEISSRQIAEYCNTSSGIQYSQP